MKRNHHRLVRSLSGACETRNPFGPTSCRQVQLLRMLTPLANNRKDLSALWRGALEHPFLGPPLVEFFHQNRAHSLVNREESLLDVLEPRHTILPFVLARRQYVLHYFLILVTGDKYSIYSAYGSDYVRIHPQEIPLDLDEFFHFIESVHKDSIGEIHRFIRKYFLEGGSQQSYWDEGKSRRVYPSIEEGKKLELAQYNEPFQILYYPTLLEHLYDAAKPTLDKIARRHPRRSVRLAKSKNR